MTQKDFFDFPGEGPDELHDDPLQEELKGSPLDEVPAPTGEQLRDEGMARGDSNSDPEWKKGMAICLDEVLVEKFRFTSDDVFYKFQARYPELSTHDQRAFGAIMRAACLAGKCKKADCAPIPTTRANCHKGPRTVWESLIYVATKEG